MELAREQGRWRTGYVHLVLHPCTNKPSAAAAPSYSLPHGPGFDANIEVVELAREQGRWRTGYVHLVQHPCTNKPSAAAAPSCSLPLGPDYAAYVEVVGLTREQGRWRTGYTNAYRNLHSSCSSWLVSYNMDQITPHMVKLKREQGRWRTGYTCTAYPVYRNLQLLRLMLVLLN